MKDSCGLVQGMDCDSAYSTLRAPVGAGLEGLRVNVSKASIFEPRHRIDPHSA